MEFGAILYLFLLCFPVSVGLWSVAILAAGYADDVEGMPWEFRLAVRITGARRPEGFAPMAFAWPLILLAFVNVPLPYLALGPHPLLDVSVAAVYVLLHILWLRRIRGAVLEAR